MKVNIDRAGRIVVPKQLREALALTPDARLEIELVDDHLEISHPAGGARVVEGEHGPMVAATGNSLTAADVRRLLEATRDRR